MKKFTAQFTKTFELEIEANDLKAAEAITTRFIAQFPAGTVRRLSITPEGYAEKAEEPNTADLNEKRNAGLAVRVRDITGDPEAA